MTARQLRAGAISEQSWREDSKLRFGMFAIHHISSIALLVSKAVPNSEPYYVFTFTTLLRKVVMRSTRPAMTPM